MPARFPLPERWRPKSIRAKVVTLLTVPVLSLMALWGHAAVTTASQVSSTEQLRQINSALVKPVADFTTAVQDERAAALKYRAAPGPSARRAFDAARSRTDRAVTALRAGIRSSSTDLAALDAQLPDRISALLKSAGSLPAQRGTRHDSAAVFSGYGTAVDRAFAVRAGLAAADRPDRASHTRTVLELARAREALSRQDAVLGAAQARGKMSAAQYRVFIGDVAQQRGLTKAAVPDLRAEGAARYRAVLASRSATELATAQDAVLDAGQGRAVSAVPAGDWHTDVGHTLAGLAAAERAAIDTGADTKPYSLATLGSSGLAVALGLLGVVVSLLLSVRIGRGLVDDLTGLRNSALELAATRLPAAIRRIHSGDDLDLEAEAPLVRTPIRDEIGQVGAALTTVQRAALRAVAGRAAVLTGVSGVYVSLARRSQVLLHRQLELLDAMERRTENPTDLEDLFRLDHLTTRMRRHAESLLILSGSAPGRAWRNSVPLIDTVRAGIAETADMDRVQLDDIPDLRLAGTAVADLMHLIAELTENAAAFSPPHTPWWCAARRSGPAPSWRSRTAASVWATRRSPRPTRRSGPRTSTSSTRAGSASSWSTASPSGSRWTSPCAARSTAASPPSSSFRSSSLRRRTRACGRCRSRRRWNPVTYRTLLRSPFPCRHRSAPNGNRCPDRRVSPSRRSSAPPPAKSPLMPATRPPGRRRPRPPPPRKPPRVMTSTTVCRAGCARPASPPNCATTRTRAVLHGRTRPRPSGPRRPRAPRWRPCAPAGVARPRLRASRAHRPAPQARPAPRMPCPTPTTRPKKDPATDDPDLQRHEPG